MKMLAGTFVAMLFVDTLGAVNPFRSGSGDFGGGGSYLPTPRVYLATFLLWGLLGIVAGLGDNAARLAGRLAGVVLLTAALVGPFGKRAISFVNTVSGETA